MLSWYSRLRPVVIPLHIINVFVAQLFTFDEGCDSTPDNNKVVIALTDILPTAPEEFTSLSTMETIISGQLFDLTFAWDPRQYCVILKLRSFLSK